MDLIAVYDCVYRAALNFLGTAVPTVCIVTFESSESVMAEINGHSVSKVRAPLSCYVAPCTSGSFRVLR